MTATTDFTGYKISAGFQTLDLIPGGNEGETDISASGDAYQAALESALAEAFPGADITVTQDRDTTGILPFDLRSHVYSETEIEDELEDQVDQIKEKVYENQELWVKSLNS